MLHMTARKDATHDLVRGRLSELSSYLIQAPQEVYHASAKQFLRVNDCWTYNFERVASRVADRVSA